MFCRDYPTDVAKAVTIEIVTKHIENEIVLLEKTIKEKREYLEKIKPSLQNVSAQSNSNFFLTKQMPLNTQLKIKLSQKKSSYLLKELQNEGILTANEFIEKMAIVNTREEAERFEKLLCSIIEPFVSKISKLKNAGLLNEQEYEQKKRKIIEKHRAKLLDEHEQKQKKCAMINKLAMIKDIISEDDYCAMNAQAFDYLDIIDKKKKLGLIKTQNEEMNEIFRLQEIHQELIECNEICFQCYAFRMPSDEKCSACGQVFNENYS